jgi:uncharacterized protein YqjF (DUF2071 family)
MTAPALPTGSIDRVGPTRRPTGWPVLRHRWAHLLFLHWPVPVEMFRTLLPDDLEVDCWDGQAYVGLVPFTMTGIRPVWAPPVFGLSSSHEVNVRTYVHRGGRDPGVWFFSLDAANAVAVHLARWLWRLPYFHARMSLEHASYRTGETPWIAYRSTRTGAGPQPATCGLRYRPRGPIHAAPPGTLEHFLVERYILYAHDGERLYRGQVHHSPYPLQDAEVDNLEETLVAAAGLTRPLTEPLAHYAAEVRVRVYAIRPV